MPAQSAERQRLPATCRLQANTVHQTLVIWEWLCLLVQGLLFVPSDLLPVTEQLMLCATLCAPQGPAEHEHNSQTAYHHVHYLCFFADDAVCQLKRNRRHGALLGDLPHLLHHLGVTDSICHSWVYHLPEQLQGWATDCKGFRCEAPSTCRRCICHDTSSELTLTSCLDVVRGMNGCKSMALQKVPQVDLLFWISCKEPRWA